MESLRLQIGKGARLLAELLGYALLLFCVASGARSYYDKWAIGSEVSQLTSYSYDSKVDTKGRK